MIEFTIVIWIIQFLIVLLFQIFSISEKKAKRKYNHELDLDFNWWQLLGGLFIPFSVPLYVIYWTIKETFKVRKK